MMQGTAEIGVIGGVGLEAQMTDVEQVVLETPYGAHSEPMHVGLLHGRRVAAIVRRGPEDVIQPHLVPHRANIWALASVGVATLITFSSGGGLREQFGPGAFVVSDQFIDCTQGGVVTFYDDCPSVQVSASEPFHATLRSLAAESLTAGHRRMRDFGTCVGISGPRFPTRAEAKLHAASGGDLLSSTVMPETGLALELGMAVVNVTFLTHSEVDDQGGSSATVRQRIVQARPILLQTAADIVRGLPRDFRASSDAPEDAVARVLARRE